MGIENDDMSFNTTTSLSSVVLCILAIVFEL